MKRCLLFASALVAALLFSVFAIADDHVLTEDEKKDGWQLLFNGTDLTGWKCNNGKPIAAPIENGSLVPYKSTFGVSRTAVKRLENRSFNHPIMGGPASMTSRTTSRKKLLRVSSLKRWKKI